MSFKIPNIQPVSREDLSLALHITNAAYKNEFPLNPAHTRIAHQMGFDLNYDHPYVRIVCSLYDSFKKKKVAVSLLARLEAIQSICKDPEVSKWVKWNTEEGAEFAEALMDAACYFPVKNFRFRKGFAAEVQKVANEKYNGQFS